MRRGTDCPTALAGVPEEGDAATHAVRRHAGSVSGVGGPGGDGLGFIIQNRPETDQRAASQSQAVCGLRWAVSVRAGGGLLDVS